MADTYLDLNGLARYHAGIKQKLEDKVSEPAQEGSSGYVLATDGQGGRSWRDITDVSNYAYAASAKANAEKCTAYAASFQTAEYEIDTNGHLVITFAESQVAAAEEASDIATYAAHAETAANTVEDCYCNITNASLFLNTDGHLIVSYPST